MKCNIDSTDRTNRIVIGVALIIAALLGVGKIIMIIIGLILIIEGAIGWCGIPGVVKKCKEFFKIG